MPTLSDRQSLSTPHTSMSGDSEKHFSGMYIFLQAGEILFYSELSSIPAQTFLFAPEDETRTSNWIEDHNKIVQQCVSFPALHWSLRRVPNNQLLSVSRNDTLQLVFGLLAAILTILGFYFTRRYRGRAYTGNISPQLPSRLSKNSTDIESVAEPDLELGLLEYPPTPPQTSSTQSRSEQPPSPPIANVLADPSPQLH